jgi:hypothetical protein
LQRFLSAWAFLIRPFVLAGGEKVGRKQGLEVEHPGGLCQRQGGGAALS